ncbi:DNA polymerase III subunit delta' [Aestuariibius sp. HNIBRBA575]|uniref:DNA polymerase III subunit delta' n=1 Tax=Aestuariibius sp. HNIBRBA575 TaxID=3233343 RepID=UPI0034A1F8DA
MAPEDRPEPDRIAGAPHPRETQTLIGQDAAQAEFLEAYNSGRLHSGWLITGPRGVGKATLAWKIATFLLAEPPQDGGLFGAPPPPTSLNVDPDHPDAHLVQSGAHPRLYVVRRPFDEKSGKLKTEITADPVRALKGFFHLSATDGGRRVVIVDCADEMNVTAANSLLKELEEPPANTTILLISHQPAGLLATIKSRCRELRLGMLTPDDMQQAMQSAGIVDAEAPALAALSGGSVGEAILLHNMDGLALYSDLIKLFSGMPRMDRTIALALAESCVGVKNAARFGLMLDLIDLFLSRTARAGIIGEPHQQAAPHEALLLVRLSPHDVAARAWAALAQELTDRSRHGRAVNLDPASLILDMFFKIEETAQKFAAS